MRASLLQKEALMAADAAPLETDDDTPGTDTFVPDPLVQKEFGVTAMSIWRWDRDPDLIKLGWPPPIRIRSRKFRSRIALENFKRVMARRAIEQRGSRERRAPKSDLCDARNRANDSASIGAAGARAE
jgi:hypothetical protein